MKRSLIIALLLASAHQASLADMPEGVMLKGGASVNFMWVKNDGAGYRWDIDSNGTVVDGTDDAYDGGLQLRIKGSRFSASSGTLDASGRPEIQVGPWKYNNIQVYRRIFVHPTRGYCRWVDIFYNGSPEEVTVDIEYYTKTPSAATLIKTNSGDTIDEARDWAMVSTSAADSPRPAVGHVFGSSDARMPLKLSMTGDRVYLRGSVTIPPGKPIALCVFALQERSWDKAVSRLAAFDPYGELMELDAPLRRIVVNMVGTSTSAGNVELRRSDVADIMIPASTSNVVPGAIQNKQFLLKTGFGDVTISADKVIGLAVRDRREGTVMLVTTTGEVIGGTLSEPVEFAPAEGKASKLTLADFEQISFKISDDKPVDVASDKPSLMLRNGDVLGFESDRTWRFITRHGTLALGGEELGYIQLTGSPGGLHRAMLRNGTQLAGILEGGAIKCRLAIGMDVEIPSQQLAGIWYPGEFQPGDKVARLTMRDGNVIRGQLLNEQVELKTPEGTQTIMHADLLKLEFSEQGAGPVTLTRQNGGKLAGKFQTRYLQVAVSKNIQLKIGAGLVLAAELPKAPGPDGETTTQPETAPSDQVGQADPDSLPGAKAALDKAQKDYAAVTVESETVKRNMELATRNGDQVTLARLKARADAATATLDQTAKDVQIAKEKIKQIEREVAELRAQIAAMDNQEAALDAMIANLQQAGGREEAVWLVFSRNKAREQLKQATDRLSKLTGEK